MSNQEIYWIDLFCGAGGTTTGIHLADANAKVVACVNHDTNAIESHKANHPESLHLLEDIRDIRVVKQLKKLVKRLRAENPDCKIMIWASLECTNYSKAKGGQPRDADSRTLANHLLYNDDGEEMYLPALDPDGLFIENVREFMAWGPLDKSGRPVSRRNGSDYVKWCNSIIDLGYKYDYKFLNAANFGGYTSRERYFAQFVKPDIPIAWPEETHAKEIKSDGLFAEAKEKWKEVKDVLELENEGRSIFDRKKPLVENTLKRIYAGLLKFVAKGDDSFLQKYYSGRPKGKVISTKGPAGTVTTVDGQSYVNVRYLIDYQGSALGTDRPLNTIVGKDTFGKIDAQFLVNYYSAGGQISDIDSPAPTITSVPKSNLVNAFMLNNNSSTSPNKELSGPAPTVTQRTHYLVNPQFSSKGASIEKPSPTLIARQDKKPLSIVTCEHNESFGVIVFEDDSETMILIKKFMVAYGIIDIKMRMLTIKELLKIQGFPEDYVLKGTQTEQKKYIGNSVVPLVAKKIVEANYHAVQKEVAA